MDKEEDPANDGDSVSTGSPLGSSVCGSSQGSDSEASECLALTPSPTSWAAQRQQRMAAKALAEAAAPARAVAPDSPPLAPTTTSSVAQRQHRMVDGASPGAADVAKTIRSSLNKLTVEKFEVLLAKLTSCGIQTPQHVEILVHEILNKATAQHHFVSMYADLCMRLEKELSSDVGESFKKILLGKCQVSFQQLLEPPPNSDNDEEAQARHKEQILGSIKFIGELMVRKMLRPKVLLTCAEALLQDAPSADRLECLAALLKVTGPFFDCPAWCGHSALVGIFDQVLSFVQAPAVPVRTRCLLQDVLDLRESGWEDTKQATCVKGPMRLEDVHREAMEESPFIAHTTEAQQRLEAEAQKRLEQLNGTDFTNVYVKNPPRHWDEAKFLAVFSKFGPIKSHRIMSDKLGRKFALFNFRQGKAARKCVVEMHMKDLRNEEEKSVEDYLLYVVRAQSKKERQDVLDAKFGRKLDDP